MDNLLLRRPGSSHTPLQENFATASEIIRGLGWDLIGTGAPSEIISPFDAINHSSSTLRGGVASFQMSPKAAPSARFLYTLPSLLTRSGWSFTMLLTRSLSTACEATT
jgi:hypothetical protein